MALGARAARLGQVAVAGAGGAGMAVARMGASSEREAGKAEAVEMARGEVAARATRAAQMGFRV